MPQSLGTAFGGGGVIAAEGAVGETRGVVKEPRDKAGFGRRQLPSSSVDDAGASSSRKRCKWAMKYRMWALSTVRWASDFQAL